METDESDYEEKDLRERLYEILQKFNLCQVDVARETGINHSTLSQWLQQNTRGNQIKIDEKIENWLINVENNRPKAPRSDISRKLELEKQQNMSNCETLPKDLDSNIIPIEIEIDREGVKFKDTILWDLAQPWLNAALFAQITREDLDLPQSFETEIAKQIEDRVIQYIKEQKLRSRSSKKDEEIIPIEIDLRIDDLYFRDKFTWDTSNQDADPEYFARVLCTDVGLDGAFEVAIAQEIRKQIEESRRGGAHFAGRGSRGHNFSKSDNSKSKKNANIENLLSMEEIPEDYIKQVEAIREMRGNPEALLEWSPIIEYLTPKQIKEHEKYEERSARYKKRRR